MNPRPESQVGQMPLARLWELCVEGHTSARFHKNLAARDALRQGIAISQAAEALLDAFEMLRLPRVRGLIKEELYDKVRNN